MSAALKFNGTDGPWTAVDTGGGDWLIRGREDGEYVEGRPVDHTPIVVDFIGNEDDARLIAAAPELLEALVCAADTIQKLVDMGRIPANSKALRDATAAIAKALT